jgi:hypothetical protein
MSAAAALYGAVCGMWNGARLAAYVALKLPLVLGVTWALTLLLSWLGASLLGLPLRFAQVAVLILLGLAAGSLLLASLAPVAALFTLCAPHPDETARTAHNLLYLMHTAFVGGCGFAGTLRESGARLRSRRQAREGTEDRGKPGTAAPLNRDAGASVTGLVGTVDQFLEAEYAQVSYFIDPRIAHRRLAGLSG